MSTTSLGKPPRPAEPTLTRVHTGEVRGNALRRALRGWRWWVAALAILLTVATVLVLTSDPPASQADYGHDNSGKNGSRALAQLLERRGQSVRPTHTWQAIADAPADSVVFVPGAAGLPPDVTDALAKTAADVVVGAPVRVGQLLPGVSFGKAAVKGDELKPGCSLAAAEKAGAIRVRGLALTSENQAYVRCYGGANAVPADTTTPYLLIQGEQGGRKMTALADADFLTNKDLAIGGHAALAIGLLGTYDTVYWVAPEDASLLVKDREAASSRSTQFLSHLFWSLLAVFGAVWWWRGRRLGKVVREHLPVVVKSSESAHGLGTLMRSANAYPRAAELLRSAAAMTLARRVGVSSQASAEQVCDATATYLGCDRAEVAAVLLAPVNTPTELAAVAKGLQQLQQQLATAPDTPSSGVGGQIFDQQVQSSTTKEQRRE